MSGAGFRFDVKDLLKGLTEYNEKMVVATHIYAETIAKDFESYAKENRPWTDRTSHARQGLTGYVTTTGHGWRVNIAHTVDYGFWLEYAREKKYAILEPTIRLKGPDALKAWANHFGKS